MRVFKWSYVFHVRDMYHGLWSFCFVLLPLGNLVTRVEVGVIVDVCTLCVFHICVILLCVLCLTVLVNYVFNMFAIYVFNMFAIYVGEVAVSH